MENFFNWIMKPIGNGDVINWFDANNMQHEYISLYFDIVISLSIIISDTYLGGDSQVTQIEISNEDMKNHFEWCWKKLIMTFKKENISIKEFGEHRDYLETFFWETFYISENNIMRDSIPQFIDNMFSIDKSFSQSDLEVLTEVYKLMERNVDFNFTS
jgi:hypothetical protein